MKTICGFLTVVMLSVVSAVHANDISAGEAAYKAGGCGECHGEAGNSPDPDMYPKTAGLDRDYIIKQLNAFRSGARYSPVMTPIARTLTAGKIANLAAYLSAQK